MRGAPAAAPPPADAPLAPPPPPLLAPLVIPPLTPGQAAGLDLILEGFLLHHGSPRHAELAERGQAVLAGDYCYAHGLVLVAESGDLFVIEALSDLIALGAGLVASGSRAALPDLWRATAAAIAARGGRGEDEAAALLHGGKDRLRDRADAGGLAELAGRVAPTPALAELFGA